MTTYLLHQTNRRDYRGVFEVLADLFDRVGFQTNTHNTVSMSCQPCHTPGRMSVVAYERRAMGASLTYWELQRMLVQCLHCRVEFMVG